jgi:hypothetical protein
MSDRQIFRFHFSIINMTSLRSNKPLSFLVFLLVCTLPGECFQLLSDVPTPAFILDVQFLQFQLGSKTAAIPSLILDNQLLVPIETTANCSHSFDSAALPFDALQRAIPPGLFYLHSKVIQSRSGDHLAVLDLPPKTHAHLVLGLNNHHVGSYYWARSTGAGAAMEAPGVILTHESALQWNSLQGFPECNSNDGKRSEWVGFLKVNDQVQLLPHNPVDALTLYTDRVYGVSNQGRPLGSEPMVVCKWQVALR